MSVSSSSVDQKRKFGFKETREQYELRKKQEKQSKWDDKLSKENISKLRDELESLERARFLAPQQNERKRLVQRMIRDLEAKNRPTEAAEPEVQKEPSPPPESDSDDDLIFSRDVKVFDEDRQLFIPRKLRKKEDDKAASTTKDEHELAAEAEKELLAAREDDSDLEAFIDTLI